MRARRRRRRRRPWPNTAGRPHSIRPARSDAVEVNGRGPRGGRPRAGACSHARADRLPCHEKGLFAVCHRDSRDHNGDDGGRARRERSKRKGTVGQEEVVGVREERWRGRGRAPSPQSPFISGNSAPLPLRARLSALAAARSPQRPRLSALALSALASAPSPQRPRLSALAAASSHSALASAPSPQRARLSAPRLPEIWIVLSA